MNRVKIALAVVAVVAVVGALVWLAAGRSGEADDQTGVPAGVGTTPAPVDTQTATVDPAADGLLDGTMSAATREGLAEIEQLDEARGIVTLADRNGKPATFSTDSIYTRLDLVDEFGWSEADILGEDSAYDVAAAWVEADRSFVAADSNAAGYTTSAALSTGDLRAERLAFAEAAKEKGASRADFGATSVVTLVWADRGSGFAETNHDTVVMAVTHTITVDANGGFDTPAYDYLVLQRTAEGWRVAQVVDIDKSGPAYGD